MNLFDSSFLCLDIGTSAVRGAAHRVRSGRITKSAMHTAESFDTVFAIKSVVDELEKQIGTRFDSAYITGNFGQSKFDMIAKSTMWSGEHKITPSDITHQISQIKPDPDFYPMHIIPLRYDTGAARNLLTPVGHTDRQMTSIYGAIFYEKERTEEIISFLRRSHIQVNGFMDSSMLMASALREKKQTVAFVDFGATMTTISIWTTRGPVFFEKIPMGMASITRDIANEFELDFDDAEKIKRAASNAFASEMDRFTPADATHDFSRADLNEIVVPRLLDILDAAGGIAGAAIRKYIPAKMFISGGGANIPGIEKLVWDTFGVVTQNLGADAAVSALARYVWTAQASRIRAYLARREKSAAIAGKIKNLFKFKMRKKSTWRAIPVMPSTLAFDMGRSDTYDLFRAGGVSMIHVDIMDGFFVNRVAGGIEELKHIRANTTAHLHVHLMTESPVIWAADAASAGADTIIVSTNTAGVRAALRKIREMGKLCGIALNPESPVDILRPVLKEIDEILVMSVKPGKGGQEFDTDVLHKISVLAGTRKKYGLNYKICVDGGINPDTAAACWAAGADYLVSGSYLARASDFPAAVQSLIPNDFV